MASDRAARVARACQSMSKIVALYYPNVLRLVEREVKRAVEEEREACVAIGDDPMVSSKWDYRDRIRARGKRP